MLLERITSMWLRLVVLGAVISSLGFGVIRMALGPKFRSEVVVEPTVDDQSAGGIGGLAAQFGVTIPGIQAAGDPIRHLAEIAESRDLFSQVLSRRYPTADGNGPRTLWEKFDVIPYDRYDSVSRGVRLIHRLIEVTTNRDANTVTIAAMSRDPVLGEALADSFVVLLDAAQIEAKRQQASTQREFIATQAQLAADSLFKAEEEVRRFLEANRRIDGSPELTLEQSRLTRRIDIRQQVLLGLEQSLEQARIAEVKNTPGLSIIQHSEHSTVREGTLLGDMVEGGLGAAVLILVLLGLSRQAVSWARSRPERMALVGGIADDFQREMNAVIGLLRRRRRPHGDD